MPKASTCRREGRGGGKGQQRVGEEERRDSGEESVSPEGPYLSPKGGPLPPSHTHLVPDGVEEAPLVCQVLRHG